ncbi:WhiB family transcriptional regulator [Streptomyces bluensis]|uniref:WhiB family transcriptional regulator n=1 Tax=Streptomyces bluensis TaxID=33897 RepID=A0ABW6UUB9_9ACTN
MTGTTGMDPRAAHRAWTEHRWYRYRGCAPDPTDPSRMAGNPELLVGAHLAPDVDGGEPQADRLLREDAAVEVCLGCPVMVQCDAYANSVTPDGRLAEPDGVWGGRRALERHRAFIAKRHEVAAAVPDPDRKLRTKQKLAVLAGLAVHTDPYEVAQAAGVDVRTANWQRARLTRQLGLAHTASRGELLAAASVRGLIEGVTVVEDDGSVPAIPPLTHMPAVEAPEPAPEPAAVEDAPAGGPLRLQSPRRDRFTDVSGQLALWEAELCEMADVHDLFLNTPASLEAAA